MTFLATRGTHYVMNPKHDRFIGTVLLFVTEKVKQQSMDLFYVNKKLTTARQVSFTETQHNTTQRVHLVTFNRYPCPK